MSNRSNPLRYVFAFLLFAISFFAITWVVRRYVDPDAAALNVVDPSVAPNDLLAYELNTISVFQKASPAVVFVHNLQTQRNIWTMSETEVQQGTGSGFLWDKEGHIVTNYHVVAGAHRIAVTLIDGKTYEAQKIGEEPGKDLAVLKIDLLETNVTPLGEVVADSFDILVGQKTLAIGNPYGLDHTLTVGNVSALGRSMRSIVKDVTIRDMIQTDAAINPGNSGGPLLDSKGRLVGMNTLILRNSTGIGFAVPSNTIKRIVDQIIEYGQAIRLGIGVQIFSDREFARLSRTPGGVGVMLREVYPDSPADEGGLRGPQRDESGRIIWGDVIVAIDSKPIRNLDDLYHAFDNYQVGQEAEIVYIRDGTESEVTVAVETITE